MTDKQKTPWTNRTCEHCGTRFYAKRSDTRFCSANCRVANHRQPTPAKRVDAITEQLYSLLHELAAYAEPGHDESYNANVSLAALHKTIGFFLPGHDTWWHCPQCKTTVQKRLPDNICNCGGTWKRLKTQ